MRGHNDQAQLPGRLERLHTTESRNAGPVSCSNLFGDPMLGERSTSGSFPIYPGLWQVLPQFLDSRLTDFAPAKNYRLQVLEWLQMRQSLIG